jgi:di/tricarboxylate transporter
MEDTYNASIMTKVASFLFFVILTIASFWWFVASSYGTLHSLFYGNEVVYFSKGAMYSFGAGVVLLLLTLLGVYQNVKKNDLSKAQTKWATKIFVLSTVAMFVFPVVAHFTVNNFATKNGYFECKEMSYQWLLYKKIVYVNSQAVCTNLVKSREMTKRSSGR